MKKIFIYFVIGFFNIHSFCTEVYGAGEETKPALPITEQLKTAIKKRTSEVASLNNKNKFKNPSNNVIKLEELKNFIKTELLNNISDVENINKIKDLNEELKPNYTRSSKELSRILEEAQELLLKSETLSPPEKKKLIDEIKSLKEEASKKEIALRKNPSKKFDPKILQQVNANLLAKVSEAEILYSKKDPKLTDERIRQTLLLAKTAQNVMEGLSNINDILSGVEEKRSALNIAKNYFSKYDSDEKVYDLLQNIDKSLKTLDGFDQDNGSENTFDLKNKIEVLGDELYGQSMGFDLSDKKNKKSFLEKAEEINTKVSANKSLWDRNLSELENLMEQIKQTSEELKQAKPEIKKETPTGLSRNDAEKSRLEKKIKQILEKNQNMQARLTEDVKRFKDNKFDEINKVLKESQNTLTNIQIDSGDLKEHEESVKKFETEIEDKNKERTKIIAEIQKNNKKT
jgi:DNA repair exonuclease SbcCD ATPase subunit